MSNIRDDRDADDQPFSLSRTQIIGMIVTVVVGTLAIVGAMQYQHRAERRCAAHGMVAIRKVGGGYTCVPGTPAP